MPYSPRAVSASTTSNGGGNYQRIEIQLNDTDDTTDDLVRLKVAIPKKRWWINGTVRSVNASEDIDVTLNSPDGRLMFSVLAGGQPSATYEIQGLPQNGLPIVFAITGEKKSNSKGDAVIQVHHGGVSGPVIGTKAATVFYFDPSDITIGRGGSYRLDNNGLYAPDGVAVHFSGVGIIKPSGVDCSVPQIKDIRIGFAQNTTSSYDRVEFTFQNMVWDKDSNGQPLNGAPFPPGTQAAAPAKLIKETTVSGQVCDSDPSALPVYDQPTATTPPHDPLSLTIPQGCNNGQPAASTDTPDCKFTDPVSWPALREDGTQVATAYYRISRAQIITTFEVWVVTYDKSETDPGTSVIPLRQTTWSLNVDSSLNNQYATVPDKDRDPTFAPLTAPPLANVESNKPNNTVVTPSAENIVETK